MYTASWKAGNQLLNSSAPEWAVGSSSTATQPSVFSVMQRIGKPRDRMSMSPLLLLWHKVGLLAPGYIMQELTAINCAVCEPPPRHCRQGRETLARICINLSKKMLQHCFQGERTCCNQFATKQPTESLKWWHHVEDSEFSAAGRSITLQWRKLWRAIKVTLTELYIFSMSSPTTAPSLGPYSGPGMDNMEADWYHKWVLLCTWSSVFISGICSLRDTDVIHKDPHTLCPVPPVHPKKSCSDVLVFALIYACLVVQSCLTLYDPDEACQAPLSMGFFSGKNTGVGCHFLLQEIFPTQSLNPHLICLLHCRQILQGILLLLQYYNIVIQSIL